MRQLSELVEEQRRRFSKQQKEEKNILDELGNKTTVQEDDGEKKAPEIKRASPGGVTSRVAHCTF